MQELLILCALEEEFSKEDNRYAESIFYTGVGKVNSCIAAMELIKERDPTLVINVGTAGSCRNDIEGIIECGVFKDRDDVSDFNEKKEIEIDSNLYTISTGDNFESDKIKGCDIVDMESYAIATVCQRYGVDFKCYKYITDYTDPKSKEDWKDNIQDGKPFFLTKLHKLLGY
jgi:adenosylhomocysteine nucleosidase